MYGHSMSMRFEWDEKKNALNQEKHGVSFAEAEKAFYDPDQFIETDVGHSEKEKRYLLYGKVENKIMTVRFTMRKGVIRIFGAAYWRKGKNIYAEKNSI